ncbi:hypothetical protein LIER_35925 [Lithospermum erythrorhizon]|uniref:Uncharacterized protein n=1 Tax=Lithospermum erythrorhizon TaxID=34254 RepID=A0AAV3NZI1_LITER
MSEKRVPLFKRNKMVKKSSQESAPSMVSTSPGSATMEAIPTILGKRPSTADAPPKPLFSKWMKSIAHKMPVTGILDLTKDVPVPVASRGDVSQVHLPGDTPAILREESNSAPKAKTGYSANYLELPYTLPGGFQVTKDFTLRDSMEIHGHIMKYLIKAMNASYVLSRRADRLDDSYKESLEKEMALSLKVKELEVKKLQLILDQATKRANEAEEKAKVAEGTANVATSQRVSEAIEAYKRSAEYGRVVGKEAAYYLCRFAKSYKDVCPAIVDHYQDFIQGYPEDWFQTLTSTPFFLQRKRINVVIVMKTRYLIAQT